MIIEHGKIITRTYYDGEVIREAQQVEQCVFTDRNSMLKELIDSVSVLHSGVSKDVDINIKVDKQGRFKLTRKWLVL